MEEPAFRRLRQGLPPHLHGRLVYQAGPGATAKVVARGLGALPIEKQLDDLKDWLERMAAEIPTPDAEGQASLAEQHNQRNADVLVV